MGKVNQNVDKALVLQSNLDCAMGIQKQCTTCCRKFGLFLRESKCYMCKRSTCNDCLLEKQKIVYVKNKKVQENDRKKICLTCDTELKQYKEQYNTITNGFGKDSSTSIRWLKTLKIIANENVSDESNPEESRNSLESLEKQYWLLVEKQLVLYTEVKYKDFILQKVNYSLLNHIQQTSKDISFEEMQIILCRIVNKLANHYKWLKAPVKVDVILLFLLTFSSEASAYNIFKNLYENILPRYIIESMHFNTDPTNKGELWSIQMAHLFKTVSINQELNELQQKQLTTFLEKFALDMLSSLFINILNFKSSFGCLDMLIQTQKFSTVENMLLVLILNEINHIKELSNAKHFNTYTYLSRIIQFSDISEKSINHPPEQSSSAYKSLPAIFINPQESSESSENMTPSSKQNKSRKSNNQGNTQLTTTTEFQQNYEELMMSPHFNLLITNNMNEIGQEQSEDEDDFEEDTTPQSVHNEQSDANHQKTEQQQQQEQNNETVQQSHISVFQLEFINEGEDQQKSNECNKCISKDRIIQSLRIENEQMQEDLAAHKNTKTSDRNSYSTSQTSNDFSIQINGQSILKGNQNLVQENEILKQENQKILNQLSQKENEMISKEQTIEQLKSTHNAEQEKLRNEIKELIASSESSPLKSLLEKYKGLVAEAKEVHEGYINERQLVEEQLISEKEEILVQSIRDKTLFMHEIEELEKISQSQQSVYEEEKGILQRKIDEHATKIAEVEMQNDRLKYDVKLLNEQHVINQDNSIKSHSLITELMSEKKRQNEKETDCINQLQLTIDQLQRVISQTAQDHKYAIDKFTDANNHVYEELRTQIDEGENRIKQVEEELENLKQKLQLEQQLHVTSIQTLEQEQEVQRISIKQEHEQQRCSLIDEHQEQLRLKDQTITELQHTITQSQLSLQQTTNQLLLQIEDTRNQLLTSFQDEKKEIQQQNECLLQQKDLIISQLEERITLYKQQIEEEKALIIKQCETEKTQIKIEEERRVQEKQDIIDSLNQQISQMLTEKQVEKVNLLQQFEQEKNSINELHQKQIQEKEDSIRQLEQKIILQSEEFKSIEKTHHELQEEKDKTILSLQTTIVDQSKEIESLKLKITEVEYKIQEKNKTLASHQITVLEKDDEIQQLKDEINRANSKLDRLKELEEELLKVKPLIEQVSQLDNQVTQLTHQLANSKTEIHNLNIAIQEKDKEHSGCDEIINKLKQDLDKQKQKLQQKQQELNVYLNIFQSVKQTVNEVNKESTDE